METPNALKGYLYPSSRVARCPKFHPCIGTHKCQNYDQHNFVCALCETRSTLKCKLGGYVSEGTYAPDLQHSIMLLQQFRHQAYSSSDYEAQNINGAEITNKYNKLREAGEQMAHFRKYVNMSMEEQIVRTMADPEVAKYLGRLE